MSTESLSPVPDPLRRRIILFLAGANLTLVQFLAMREFAALLGSNELVVLLVVAGYFLGLSAGYLVSRRLSRRTLLTLGIGTLVLHASLPFSVRWFSGAMASIDLAGNTPPFLFCLTLFGLTPFYAVFLPRLIGENESASEGSTEKPHERLVRCYATELAGGLAGLAVLFVIPPARMEWIAALHLTGLVVLLFLAVPLPRPWRWSLPLLPIVYLAAYPSLQRSSLEFHLRETHRYRDVRVLASEFSPYQRVDFVAVRARTSDRVATNLYLNGNLLYGSRSLHEHNLMVSVLPNLLAAPEGQGHALVIAGGSLDNARYLAPRVRQLRVVEIDETVVRLARRHLQEPRGDFPSGWDLVIDDGKHFLGNWRGEAFDTICVDVPVPTHLQTAMLHSERFFALARGRLKPGGIFSISLSGHLDPRGPDQPPSQRLSARIMAGLLATFPHVMVARLGDHDFAWASGKPIREDLASLQRRIDGFRDSLPGLLQTFGHPRIGLIHEKEIESRARGSLPIGEADMQIVLRLSLAKLRKRFYDPD